MKRRLLTILWLVLSGAVVMRAALGIAFENDPLPWILPLAIASMVLGIAATCLARQVRETDEARFAKRRARLDSRESVPPTQIYDTFYAESGLDEASVVELWLEVARTLQLDPEKMRPTDRFDTEYEGGSTFLGMRIADEWEDLEEILIERLEERNLEADTPETLDEYIRLFGRGRSNDEDQQTT